MTKCLDSLLVVQYDDKVCDFSTDLTAKPLINGVNNNLNTVKLPHAAVTLRIRGGVKTLLTIPPVPIAEGADHATTTKRDENCARAESRIHR